MSTRRVSVGDIWARRELPNTVDSVPTISVFYGIVIAMFFNDHDPPHFHARYGEHHARFDISNGELLGGDLPPRATRLVREWTELHRDALIVNWERARELRPLAPIEPLQ